MLSPHISTALASERHQRYRREAAQQHLARTIGKPERRARTVRDRRLRHARYPRRPSLA